MGIFDFYKEQKNNNRKGFNNSVLFTILSLITLYFSINIPFVFFVSIPLTMMGVSAIYHMVNNYKNYLINEETELFNSLSFEGKKKYLKENTNSLISSYVENYIEKEKERKLEEKEEKLIDKEKDIFHSLSIEEKKNYLKNTPDSIITTYVEEYFKEKEDIKSINDRIKSLNDFVSIENELHNKINEDFYCNISPLNFEKKLNLILTNIKENDSIKLYLEDKIKFFTFYQIVAKWELLEQMYNWNRFNDDSLEYKNKKIKLPTIRLKGDESLNECYTIFTKYRLNFCKQILKVITNPNQFENLTIKSIKNINRSYPKPINLITEIQPFLIKKFDNIVGRSSIIKDIKILVEEYERRYELMRYELKNNFNSRNSLNPVKTAQKIVNMWNHNIKELTPEIQKIINDSIQNASTDEETLKTKDKKTPKPKKVEKKKSNFGKQYHDLEETLLGENSSYNEEYGFIKSFREKLKTGEVYLEDMSSYIKNHHKKYDGGEIMTKTELYNQLEHIFTVYLEDWEKKKEITFVGFEDVEQYHSLSQKIVVELGDLLQEKIMELGK